MKALANKHNTKNRHLPCPYRRQQLESNNPDKVNKPSLFGYDQACALLQAIELNERKRLSKKCLGKQHSIQSSKTCPLISSL